MTFGNHDKLYESLLIQMQIMLVQPIKAITLFLFLMLVQSIKAVTTCLPQILSHLMLYQIHITMYRNQTLNIEVISTDCVGGGESNYRTVTAIITLKKCAKSS